MKIETTSINYAIRLDNFDDYRKIEERDAEREEEGEPRLYELIDELEGVDNTDYNGHFGASVYYRVEAECNSIALHNSIVAIIKDYIA